MTVEKINPVQTFTANGSTTAFTFQFVVEDKANIAVKVNSLEISVDEYAYDANTNSIIFEVAPVAGSEVEVRRVTDLERSIQYETYNNSFRPETLNYDLDRIWHVLQEQDIIDAEILARLKDEIEWRRTHDFNYDELAQIREKQIFNALKGYTDTLVSATNPNIFQGVVAGVVFTQDGKSVQTHIEDILKALENSRTEATATELILTQSIQTEVTRAKSVELQLNSKIQTEIDRAKDVEASLQLQITTSGIGIKYFETTAALNAYTPTEIDPKQAYVFATKKNYLWNGIAWIDEGVSILDQAKIYTDKSLEIFDHGINIFDPTDGELGKYYNYENGIISDAPSNFIAAKLIVIEPNTEYQVPNFYNQQFAYFDENKVFISGVENVVFTDYKFTTPINAKYIGMTVALEWLSTFMLCKSSEFPPTYFPYVLKQNHIQTQTKQIQDFDPSVKDVLDIYSVNIIDTSKITSGYYLEYETGRLIPSVDYCASDYYKIKPNTEYQTSANYVQQFAFYDADYNYISGLVLQLAVEMLQAIVNLDSSNGYGMKKMNIIR